MIVRILGEGQYRLDSAYLDRLNELDNRLVAAVARDSDEQFTALFSEMLQVVREKGQPVPVEELHASDVMLPDPDSNELDIKRLFAGEGLIPDVPSQRDIPQRVPEL